MNALCITLLKDRKTFWQSVQNDNIRWQELLNLLVFIILSCALYGVILAGTRSPLLSLYVSIKLPILFLGTILIVAFFNWMTACMLGSGLSFQKTLIVVLAAMSISCWVLIGLIPIVLFFQLSGVPNAGSHDELRYAHNYILMTHISVLAIAGVIGNGALLTGLKEVVKPRCSVNALFFLWIVAFAIVGCQISWILRPFVGSPFYPVAFMRADCLDRNFYEFVFMEVIPFLVAGSK